VKQKTFLATSRNAVHTLMQTGLLVSLLVIFLTFRAKPGILMPQKFLGLELK